MQSRLQQERGVGHFKVNGHGAMESNTLDNNVVCLCGWEGRGAGPGGAQDFVELLFDSCFKCTQTGMPCVINMDLDAH